MKIQTEKEGEITLPNVTWGCPSITDKTAADGR
jgi:hypothetical protein